MQLVFLNKFKEYINQQLSKSTSISFTKLSNSNNLDLSD